MERISLGNHGMLSNGLRLDRPINELRTAAQAAMCEMLYKKAVEGVDGYTVSWKASSYTSPDTDTLWVGFIHREDAPHEGVIVSRGSAETPDPNEARLLYTYMEWWAFTEGAKDGEFDFDAGQSAIAAAAGPLVIEGSLVPERAQLTQ